VALDVQAEDVLRVGERVGGVAAYFTPPALPRPPALTCALTMTGLPISSAMALAPSAVSVTRPGVVGNVVLGEKLFRLIFEEVHGLTVSSAFDFEGFRLTGSGELYPPAPTPSAPPTSHVVDLTGGGA